ncbi:MAG: MFS transporter [Christensenellaceae bacterium]|jgi:PPP family 3-phenylpropionic acid transporter|nr:MFS transporter [Christensenellaceae bacterium]
MEETRQKVGKRGFFIACAMYAAFYMSHGSYYPYITLYYKSIGITVEQIGTISAIGPLCALLVQTLWGRFADKTDRRLVWMLTLGLSGGAMLLYYLNSSFLYVFLLSGLYVLVATSSQPLMDTIALDFCAESGYRFSPIRLIGTLGFGVMPLFIGGLMQQDLRNIFPIYALFCAIAAAIGAFMPRGHEVRAAGKKEGKIGEKKGEKGQLARILKDPVVLFILCMNFVIGTCMAAVNFLPVYATDMGVSADLAGKLSTVSAAGEIVLFLFVDRLLKRFRAESIMLSTLFFTAARMLIAYLAGFAPSGGVFLALCASQAFHSLSFIMLYYCAAQSIHRRVPSDFKATAQTMVSMVSMGLSRMVGSLLTGYLGDAFGLQNTFLFFAIFALVLFAPVFWLYRRSLRGWKEAA